MTRSMDGLDNTVLSDNISMGAAAGMIGYTVNLQPQPLTEPSEVNFHLSSSPLMRNSCDQSDHSRPRKKINKILPLKIKEPTQYIFEEKVGLRLKSDEYIC